MSENAQELLNVVLFLFFAGLTVLCFKGASSD